MRSSLRAELSSVLPVSLTHNFVSSAYTSTTVPFFVSLSVLFHFCDCRDVSFHIVLIPSDSAQRKVRYTSRYADPRYREARSRSVPTLYTAMLTAKSRWSSRSASNVTINQTSTSYFKCVCTSLRSPRALSSIFFGCVTRQTVPQCLPVNAFHIMC